jgi:gluconate kinase
MKDVFVVVSGLPGSGKTTLARGLAPALGLPVLDKDDILDRLFASNGIGDAAWRRALSRESDRILAEEAARSNGAILVSFWRLEAMPSDSGTPTDWLRTSSHRIVNVHCVCSEALAASRFHHRTRHAGHRDGDRTEADILQSLRALTRLPPLDFGSRIDVDTSADVDLDSVARLIRACASRV